MADQHDGKGESTPKNDDPKTMEEIPPTNTVENDKNTEEKSTEHGDDESEVSETVYIQVTSLNESMRQQTEALKTLAETIDGEGTLVAKTPDNRIIKLSRVISASEVADNLLSLRKFTELGYGVYLDKYKLEIFDKDTGECHLRGKYVQPNWIIDLELLTSDKNNKQTHYVVTAHLLSSEAPGSQAQSDITTSRDDYRIDLGRENTQAESSEPQSTIQAETEINIKRKIIDCNQTLSDTRGRIK
ncbi:hypothetical protein TKK_0011890 [Trichogramma kaykai]